MFFVLTSVVMMVIFVFLFCHMEVSIMKLRIYAYRGDVFTSALRQTILSYLTASLVGLWLLAAPSCFGPELSGHKTGDTEFKGNILEVWNCTAAQGLQTDEVFPVQQYYSREKQLVLYSRDTNGFEMIVLGIESIPIAGNLMVPPPHYRTVSYAEFMGVNYLPDTYQMAQ